MLISFLLLAAVCLGRADLLTLLCVMFSCISVTFSYCVLGKVCYLIVSFSDLCLFLYFVQSERPESIRWWWFWTAQEVHVALAPSQCLELQNNTF